MLSIGSIARGGRDRLRQVLNIVFSIAEVAVFYIGVLNGSNDKITTNDPSSTSLLVPAGYAFTIWAPIYLGAIIYAIYQTLPSHQNDELLRRIGFYTASAYM